jgi:membrane-associated protease RseP (regulator of RpoE activity)
MTVGKGEGRARDRGLCGGGVGPLAAARILRAWLRLALLAVSGSAAAGELPVLVTIEPADRDLGASLVDARQIIDEVLVGEEGETTERGAVVLGVQRRGPAARAGLEPADAIVELDGERVWAAEDLWRILRARKLGSRVPVTFVRDGEVRTAELEVSARPQRGRFYSWGLMPAPAVNAR